MKDQLNKRLENLNAELEVYNNDYAKLNKITKDIETKIIFTRGKVAEIQAILQALEGGETLQEEQEEQPE